MTSLGPTSGITDHVTSKLRKKPIVMSAWEVNAIRNGDKTMLRRIMKPQIIAYGGPHNPTLPYDNGVLEWASDRGTISGMGWVFFEAIARHCPYGRVGDRLWVKENWTFDLPVVASDAVPEGTVVIVDNGRAVAQAVNVVAQASRLELEIVSIRVERLLDITEEDAEREGVYCLDPENDTSRCWIPGLHNTEHVEFTSAIDAFLSLWKSFIEKDQNPWVFVIEFKTVNL